ncbi:hypothetical protein BOTBODRAFT_154392 [Botryobasidium botryosum FD-172 SS1]|uniref:Importin N-terminal domain-containing protein n=1 Tax=Botryobasidium botryosum (strain FD-172 SS1) TaxID=930990 RepID=A0A067MRW2_BOTB1|nr:hypothetical protein BOTBODRAFT_154392 [Botryobasidium botryosum FD-172 SS1]
MEGILDFSKELDVSLLDRVVNAFYVGVGAERAQAQSVLTQFQENPDSWQRVPDIIAQSSNDQTKACIALYLGLQILEKLVQTRWKALPEPQQTGIKQFVIATTIATSSDEAIMRRQKTFLNKLNLLLVQLLKQEWPHNWPTFIPEIVSSSKTSLSLCENNMVILKLLSEEIFDFSAEQMTQTKTKHLKNSMCGEFSDIFQLCLEVLEKAQKPSLIKATLETLLRFLNWIPLGYIFETSIIDHLLNRFLEVPEFRNVTLKCLSEIATLNVGPEYDAKFVILFQMVMTSVNKMIPPSTDIAAAYATAPDSGQELISNLAQFLSSFLTNHIKPLETPSNNDVLLNAHLYIIKISQVDEREVFKICLEYWTKLVADLYEEIQSLPMADINPLMGLNIGGPSAMQNMFGVPLRKNLYPEVLSNLRLVMIEKMVKPEEVLVVENDEGEVVREFLKEIDTIVLYKQMREVLVYLTHLDVLDTENILTEKLSKQVDGSEWSWANLNTLCWAIGSISGAMNEETEKRFLVTVIKDLLGLCEMKRGKDNKAIVASNIMYIVGQYPRFLKAHWKFLKTVVNKLFEFMHETHEGVQDMACDTFIKIAQKCRRHFVMQQSGESEPFVDEILRMLHRITIDLSPMQVHTFYEAVGYMISAQPNKPLQEKLIVKLMEMPNSAWDALMNQASSTDVLSNPDNVKILSNVLKTNVSACTSIGSFFYPQLFRIYMDMLGVYKVSSAIISETVAKEGPMATRSVRVRSLRTIKKEILKLVDTYVKRAEDLDGLNVNLMPALLDAVLGDYNSNLPDARDAEVLNVMAVIISRMGQLLTPQVPPILGAVFECTLGMITQDFSEYPEHRVGFYRLLRAINTNCFPALLSLPAPQVKLVMDSIIWAIKHTMREIADIGLNLFHELINNFAAADQNASNAFFQQYSLPIVQDIFFVMTDTEHKSGFKLQSVILARMFQLAKTIQAPLFDPATVGNPAMTNQQFLKEYCAHLLKTAFPHVLPVQVETCVTGLSENSGDLTKFKLTLRDFLIQLKEFSGDNAELYLEEKEEEATRKAAEEREAALRIPGMLKPSQIEDEEL